MFERSCHRQQIDTLDYCAKRIILVVVKLQICTVKEIGSLFSLGAIEQNVCKELLTVTPIFKFFYTLVM